MVSVSINITLFPAEYRLFVTTQRYLMRLEVISLTESGDRTTESGKLEQADLALYSPQNKSKVPNGRERINIFCNKCTNRPLLTV